VSFFSSFRSGDTTILWDNSDLLFFLLCLGIVFGFLFGKSILDSLLLSVFLGVSSFGFFRLSIFCFLGSFILSIVN
jgi:hypothetical protein